MNPPTHPPTQIESPAAYSNLLSPTHLPTHPTTHPCREVINSKELALRKKQRTRDRHLYFLSLASNEFIDATEKGRPHPPTHPPTQ